MIHIENEDWQNVVEEILWRIPTEQRKEMIEKALIAIEKPKFTDKWHLEVGIHDHLPLKGDMLMGASILKRIRF